ncbi:ferritin family protein [Deferrisoma camini]|uniref:hypothetical protein n=1 Tax=Deferrisoma camini TaxID=1035120 RepID=UPI00046D74ED|nr:hypothetical protein [Deferrisoma camini]
MPSIPARQILEPCLRIDGLALDFYLRLAEQANDPGLSELWRAMASDENDHVGIWNRALRRWADRPAVDLVGEPEQLVRELVALELRVSEIAGRAPRPDPAWAFLAAYRLEFYLLDPAMDVLLILASGEVESGPEGAYARHIDRLVRAFDRYRGDDPMAELAGDMMRRLWAQNRVLARHLRVLHELRALVPICSGCKKIRDDAGYWEHLETYLKTHAGLEFTHGLCPDCTRQLYPRLDEGGAESAGR